MGPKLMGDGEMGLPCVGQGGPSSTWGLQPATQALPGMSSGSLGRWQCGCHQSLLSSLIPGICQHRTGQLLAFPPAPGNSCGCCLLELAPAWMDLGREELVWSGQGGAARAGREDVLWWERCCKIRAQPVCLGDCGEPGTCASG